ncbi:hypothetical protein HZA97_05845 [Candidatus Woesearchaeota archaeon]|nr:hypothetical protein [Candidatus Woesearchaeota archaeon]
MKKLIIILALLSLVLLVSCITGNSTVPTYQLGSPLKEKPVVIKVSETKLKNLCESVVCGENQACSEGVCSCKPDFRSCEDKCLPITSCCSSSDCNNREVCVDNKCEQVKLCDFGQKWNEDKKACECAINNIWCPSQQSCIPSSNCCGVRDCNSGDGLIDKLCIDSTPQLYVCIITDEEGSHCTYVQEGKRSSFKLTAENFGDINLLNVAENGVSDINVKTPLGEYLLNNVKLGEKTMFAGGAYYLKIEKTSFKGGSCSE